MKKVKLVCPSCDPITVDPDHAERILKHPTNAKAGWKLADETKNQNAAKVRDTTNKGATDEAKDSPAKDSKGGKARGKNKTA